MPRTTLDTLTHRPSRSSSWRAVARLCCAAWAALAASGCTGWTSPPALAPAVEPPNAWHTAGATGTTGALSPDELATWWRQLGDPTLDRLVERTLAGNVDLDVALTRVAEARARRGVARAALGPTVTAGTSASRRDGLDDDAGATESYAASLETSWEVDLFGANRLGVAASQADLEGTIADLQAVQVSLIAETVVAYVDLRVSEARLAILDADVATREETWQLTAWRQQAGVASRLEVTQALTSLEQVRASRPALRQRATEARLRLDLLAGETPGALEALLATPDAEHPEIPQPPPSVTVGIPAEALRQRPDVRGAERALAAAVARLGAAEAARFPSLRLTGSLDSQTASLEDLLGADSIVANLLAGLTAPIFESGRIRQNIAIQDAQVEQAALAYRATVLEALSEVESALSAYDQAREQLDALKTALLAATEASGLAEQRYAAGLVDLLTVLDTQRTRLSLEEQLISAHGELATTFAALYRALGGGWTATATGDTDA